MALAIDAPVGMAIGATFAGTAHGGGGGVLAALIIGLHNIPEGMSIATPLLAGGGRPAGAIGIAALSGLPTILGALLGYGVGTMNPLLLALGRRGHAVRDLRRAAAGVGAAVAEPAVRPVHHAGHAAGHGADLYPYPLKITGGVC